MTVGSYGSGDLPELIETQQSLDNIFEINAKRIVIQDLAFDSAFGADPDKPGAARAFHVAGQNIAVLRCRFDNVSDAANLEARPSGFLFQDNHCTTIHSLRAYLVWAAGDHIVIIGNSTLDSYKEHIVRLGGASYVFIYDNDFANVAGPGGNLAKGCFVLQACDHAVASHNHLNGGGGCGPLGGSDGASHPDERSEQIIMAYNVCYGGGLDIQPGSHHVLCHFNISVKDGDSNYKIQTTDDWKKADGTPGFPNRFSEDIRFLNNVGITMNPKGCRFLRIEGRNTGAIVTMQRNLGINPGMLCGGEETAALVVSDRGIIARSDDNVFNRPLSNSWVRDGWIYVWPTWSDPRGYKTADWWRQNVSLTDTFENVPADQHLIVRNGVEIGNRTV